MKHTVNAFQSLLLAAVVALGCSGSDGKNGANGLPGAKGADGKDGTDGADGATGKTGPQGPPGDTGKTGATGPAGPPGPGSESAGAAGAGGETSLPPDVLTAGCLSPCHGFTGIVEEWKTSRHYATYIANLGGDEAETWTGAQACGNCHAIDAIAQRVAGNVTTGTSAPPTELAHGQLNYLDSGSGKVVEAVYAGQATVAEVHCSTCHDVTADNDPHRTGKNYTAGSFPLRVPTGDGDYATLEKSSARGIVDGTPAGDYHLGNACIWCHRSRKDVTNYIAPTGNNLTSTYWGPHEGPDADVLSGLGGYHYSGQTYDVATHSVLSNGCVDCHMPEVSSNDDIGDHSFYPQLSACQRGGCHRTATSFDDLERHAKIKDNLRDLRTILNSLGYLTRSTSAPYAALTSAQLDDDNFRDDLVLPGATGLTGDQAGAVYNYLMLARGGAFGVHNPIYARQLIYDSYKAVSPSNEAPPTLGGDRP
jgi:hypothetical protein